MRVRLLKNAYSETITSYVLSGNRRDEIRKQYKAIRVVNPQVILSTPILDTLIDERSKFEHKLVEKTTANVPANQHITFVPEVADLEEEEIYEEEDDIDVPKNDSYLKFCHESSPADAPEQ